MGMSASQARLLALQARQSNLEYQGQQINQERSVLSQQCTALYNSLLAMEVPTPPSTQDFTNIEYSGTDGSSAFTLGVIKPSGENYNVEINQTLSGWALQSQYGTAIVGNKDSVRVPNGTYSVAEDTKYVEGDTYIGKSSTPGSELLQSGANPSDYLVLENGVYTPATSFEEGKSYFKKVTRDTYEHDTASYTHLRENTDEVEAAITTIMGKEAYDFETAASDPALANFDWDNYRMAIKNTYGDQGVEPKDFYVFVNQTETGTKYIQFALKEDVNSPDGSAQIFSAIPDGKYTSSKPTDGCKLTFDTQGRITKIGIPQIDEKTQEIIGYREITLTAKTVTDEAAYQDAYAEYEYAQYLYDKKQQEINAQTEIIQQEDRNLELKLQRLDNERTQITTEIEAVDKVINDNIESSYKTFSG